MRLNAARLAECTHKIHAAEQAVETVATISEGERASVMYRAFDVASRMIDMARQIMQEHPVAAARLLATATAVAQDVGGTASGYGAGAMTLQVIQRFSSGEPITSATEARQIIESFEMRPPVEELPCKGWDLSHKDATPVPPTQEDPPTTDPPPPKTGVPSRMSQMPTIQLDPRADRAVP